MRIAIDARFLTHPQKGGFKTYSENLIRALAAVDQENEYLLYVDRPLDPQGLWPDRPNFRYRVVDAGLPLVGMPWREQVGLARQAARDRLDLFHAPSLTAPIYLGCPLIVTIHDVIWLFPEKFAQQAPRSVGRKVMEWYYRFVPRLAVRRARLILTVSHAAKATIVQHLGLTGERVVVTQEAASDLFRQVEDVQALARIRQKYGLAACFILGIGSADPRKNLATLVQAYAALPAQLREQYQLVIVWTHSFLAAELAEQIERLGLTQRVRFLEQVSNEDLVLLYNAASLFVFPSRYEGFGLPPLEAMACGTPVVAANNSSLPEIVGDAALLTSAEEATPMAKLMAGLLTDERLRMDLVQKGLKQAASFSWEKCAQQTLAAYRQAIVN